MHHININYNIYKMVSIFFVFGLAKFQNDLLFRVLDGVFHLKALLPPRAIAK
jgi:hypothetical protein